jgi:UDP-N-acetylglucosamine--N-acetylmuramyl-(pentapeptide) pyrophosphoryl-undecaprenol N-acetylglucosamine transferase
VTPYLLIALGLPLALWLVLFGFRTFSGRNTRRILLTGGGTGGHVNPALAIGSILDDGRTRFLYVGTRGKVEEVVVPKAGLPIRFVRASPWRGIRPGLGSARFLVDIVLGTLESIFIVGTFQPSTVVGTGGYVAAPVVFATMILRRLGLSGATIVLHEQNAVPGKLNLLAGRFADQVFVTFPETLPLFPRNGRLTGYPVRRTIGNLDRREARTRLDFEIPEGRTVVFAFGGSQGARALNRALVDALPFLAPHRDRIFLVHGVGLQKGSLYDASADTRRRFESRYDEGERRIFESFYVRRDYFHEIGAMFALTDLAVVRGGAGSLNEVARAGLPAIVVPKANLPGDHQVANARVLARAGAAIVLFEDTVLEEGRLLEVLGGEELAAAILSLVDDPERRRTMAEKARRLFPGDALDRISRLVAEGPGTEAPDESTIEINGGAGLLPGNRTLLAIAEQARGTLGGDYRAEAVVPDPDDLAYLRRRSSALLLDSDWEERNVGVKLVGLLGIREKLPLLLAMLTDRTPASPLERLFGGDFREVGFIRRNIVQSALPLLDVVDPQVEAALLVALEDPYFEVRSAAARVAAIFAERLSRRDEVTQVVLRLFDDPHFDVAVEAVRATGRLARGPEVVPMLTGLGMARHWQVRRAALEALSELVRRGVAGDLDRLERAVGGFMLTSTDFRPHFEIKKSFADLAERLRRAKGGTA